MKSVDFWKNSRKCSFPSFPGTVCHSREWPGMKISGKFPGTNPSRWGNETFFVLDAFRVASSHAAWIPWKILRIHAPNVELNLEPLHPDFLLGKLKFGVHYVLICMFHFLKYNLCFTWGWGKSNALFFFCHKSWKD